MPAKCRLFNEGAAMTRHPSKWWQRLLIRLLGQRYSREALPLYLWRRQFWIMK